MQTSSVVFRNSLKGTRFESVFSNPFFKGDLIRLLLHSIFGKLYYIDQVMSVYSINDYGDWNHMNKFDQALSIINFYEYHKKNTFTEKDLQIAICRHLLILYKDLFNKTLSKRKQLLYYFRYVMHYLFLKYYRK